MKVLLPNRAAFLALLFILPVMWLLAGNDRQIHLSGAESFFAEVYQKVYQKTHAALDTHVRTTGDEKAAKWLESRNRLADLTPAPSFLNNDNGGDPCDLLLDGGQIGSDESNCGPFDPEIIVEVTPPGQGGGGNGGCTLTQGYWKTHSEYGPAPYDDTWALLPNGADTEFFGTGISYYDLFHTPPSGGNAYIKMAHQWMAAELNQLNGASIPANVQSAFNQAVDLFIDYQDQVNIPGGPDKALANSIQSLLDDYNNGLVGPGHCDDNDGGDDNGDGGGDLTLEYLWLASTDGCPTDLSQAIPGATEATYDPPFISETTYYVRLTRIVGCQDDNSGGGDDNGGDGDCCEGSAKPQVITMTYTGDGCDATSTSQSSDLYNCSGDPNDDPQVYIVATNKINGGNIKTWFTGTVNLNETFEIDAATANQSRLKGNTYIRVYAAQGGALLQTINFHTSCSAPINIGDQYGASRIESIQFDDGSVCENDDDDDNGDDGDNGGGDFSAAGWKASNCVVKEAIPLSECAPASLGNFVWEDLDGDGIQDPGEPGVPNVPVELQDCFGNTIATTTTDANGNYSFDNLTPGGYVVVFGPLPGDFTFTTANAGGDDALDSDAGPGGATGCIDLESGENNTTVDAGAFAPASLGDFVWEDLDADGIQDAGEPGIENVEVNLKDENGNVIATTTTDATGFYEFTGLTPGTYTVMFMGPAGFEPTPQDQGGDDTVDSDADANGNTASVTLQSGENNPTIDAGFYAPASLGDFVWEDLDGDGIQDAGEPGIPGVPVELQDCFGNTIATTTTDANGNYSFDNLTPGGYVVVFGPLPGDFTFTMANAGGDDAVDSDAGPGGATGCIDLESGENNTTVDAGAFAPASLGDFVWEDLDADGIQDAGEPGIENVEVNLKDENGNVIATTTTDATGFYEFTGLTPGTYTVMFMGPAGFEPTPQDQGGDDTVDSDADANGNTASVTLQSGENNPTIDAGFYAPASLGDFVWEDLDGDGIQDAGEPGIPGVPVELQDCFGNTIATTTTDANGNYSFDNLTPGGYVVVFGPLPGDFTFTTANAGGDDAVDSDAGPGGATGCIDLESGENNTTVDAGVLGACGTCEVSGPQGAVCPDSEQTFTAPITGLCDNPVYNWSISGNGVITADNGASVTVMAGSTCGADYTLSLSIDCDGCSGGPVVCSTTVEVNDGEAPMLANIPDDETVECNVNGCVTFEDLNEGDFVSTIFADNGRGPILVSGFNPLFPGTNAAMVFNSSVPTGGDPDLGSPNETFGGPGIGEFGEFGQPFQNDRALGNVLIVSEDLDQTDPDDDGALNSGVYIDFDFSAMGPLTMLSIDVMDFEFDQGPFIELFGDGGVSLGTFPLTELGDNGLNTINLGNTPGVRTLRVVFNGSGAVNNICFVEPSNELPETPDGTPMVSDNCDPDPTVTFSEVTTPGNCPGNYTVTRTWTATDACGNSSSESQVITVQDTDAPFIYGVPGDLTVNCDNVPPPVNPIAKDNCDPNPSLAFSETGSGDCNASYTITRTWTATDACGNSSSESQVINVIGTGPQPDLWLEAECATVGSLWTVVADVDASNGEYVLPPNQDAFTTAPKDPEDLVTFTFDLLQSGTYKVFGRTQTTGDADDSFWVRANGGAWVRWNRINSPNYGAFFQWQQVGQWDSGDTNTPVTFQLNAGSNTIDFSWREPGTKLDKIYVTLDGDTPTGAGEAAGNCGGMNSFSPLGNTLQPESGTEMKLKVYPVPSAGEINLEIVNPVDVERSEVRVYDANGKEVLYTVLDGNTRTRIDLGRFGKGLYILKVLSGNEVRHERVLIQ